MLNGVCMKGNEVGKEKYVTKETEKYEKNVTKIHQFSRCWKKCRVWGKLVYFEMFFVAVKYDIQRNCDIMCLMRQKENKNENEDCWNVGNATNWTLLCVRKRKRLKGDIWKSDHSWQQNCRRKKCNIRGFTAILFLLKWFRIENSLF